MTAPSIEGADVTSRAAPSVPPKRKRGRPSKAEIAARGGNAPVPRHAVTAVHPPSKGPSTNDVAQTLVFMISTTAAKASEKAGHAYVGTALIDNQDQWVTALTQCMDAWEVELTPKQEALASLGLAVANTGMAVAVGYALQQKNGAPPAEPAMTPSSA